ncbi:MAG: sugar ABC transporter permease [Oligoflexia bacterium]|nr:sugar ABC transporter permease [Oligoflexia bacterium]
MNFKKSLRTYTMVFALFAIWAIFEVQTDGAFLQARNLSNLLRQMSVTSILSIGMVLIIVAGHIDLSVGSVVCFLGAILTVANTKMGYSPSVSVAIALSAGALIGLMNGYLLSYQRIPSFIVTLGGMMAFRGAAMMVTKNETIPLEAGWIQTMGTGYVNAKAGWIICIFSLMVTCLALIWGRQSEIKSGLESTPLSKFILKLLGLAFIVLSSMAVLASYEGIPIPVLIMIGLMIIVYLAATRTTWGRHIYAIGGNSDAAFLSGINIKFRTLSIYVLMGLLSAIGGIILTARVGSASPDSGQLLELDAIASCVIGGTSLMGGKGSVLGAILGALVMESLNNGMSLASIEPFWQYIVKGVVLVAAVWADMLSQDVKG